MILHKFYLLPSHLVYFPRTPLNPVLSHRVYINIPSMSSGHTTAPHQLFLYMLPVPTLGTLFLLTCRIANHCWNQLCPPPPEVTMAKEKQNSVPSVDVLQTEQRQGTETKSVAVS